MLKVLFIIGLICYCLVWIRGKEAAAWIKRKGYKRAEKSTWQERLFLKIRLLLLMQVPIVNILFAVIGLFLSNKQYCGPAIKEGVYIKMDQEE